MFVTSLVYFEYDTIDLDVMICMLITFFNDFLYLLILILIIVIPFLLNS